MKDPKNMEQLWLRVQTEWAEILKRTIEKLVESVPKRIKSVRKNKRLWTKY